MSINPDRTILGTYGHVSIDGKVLGNFNHLEASVDQGLIGFNVPDEVYVQHKTGPREGKGTISGFKTTSAMLEMPDNQRFEILAKLADPESWGKESIRFRSCRISSKQWANWTSGEQVPEEVTFVFDKEPELVDPLEEV